MALATVGIAVEVVIAGIVGIAGEVATVWTTVEVVIVGTAVEVATVGIVDTVDAGTAVVLDLVYSVVLVVQQNQLVPLQARIVSEEMSRSNKMKSLTSNRPWIHGKLNRINRLFTSNQNQCSHIFYVNHAGGIRVYPKLLYRIEVK